MPYDNIFIDINKKHYIIYAENYNNEIFYIANTDPVVWTNNQYDAKRYLESKNGEFDILGDYNNYRSIRNLIDNGSIHKMYLAKIVNGEEVGRIELL